ncbi:MAG: hypothetical protein V1772_00510 [Chloroflexota bacterium]
MGAPDAATERLLETPCPRCGTRRLIRRVERLAPRLGAGLPLGLLLRAWLSPRRATLRIERRAFLCELCGHRWREQCLLAEH